MENPSPLPHSSNPYTQTLLHNPTNHLNQITQKKAMKNFQQFIFKLAETHPNKPLTPPTKTLLQGRLNRFVSEYKTPDHLPYSAMIQSALGELNEKRGSSEESISQYLEKRYDNLPWAHSVLMKHHLEKLCESGEIVVTRDQRYGLPGCLNSSTEVKRKPPRRKWRYDCERMRHNQRKQKLSKKRNQEGCEEDEVIKNHQEYDEKEQRLTENGARGEDKSDQTKRSPSCVDGENGVCRDPSFLLTEPSGINTANEKKYSEEVRSQLLEIGPSETVKADIWATQTQEQQEREQSELSSPERPPGFESIGVENLPHFGSTELELASADKFIGSNRAWRQMKRWSRRFPEPKAVIATSPEAEEYHSLRSEQNMETPQDQQKALDSTPNTVKQMHHEEQQLELIKADDVEVAQSVMNGANLKKDEKYGLRRKNKPEKSETIGIHVSRNSDRSTELQNEHPLEPYAKIDSPNLSLTLNQAVFASPNERKPQELLQQPPSQQKDIFQGKPLRRSLRIHGNQPPFLEPVEAARIDEPQHPPKCPRSRVLLKSKPNAADVENSRVVEDQRRLGLKQSGKPGDCTSIREKTERPRGVKVLLLRNSKQKRQEVQPTKRRLGRPPKREVA